jgi:hypothetical protein
VAEFKYILELGGILKVPVLNSYDKVAFVKLDTFFEFRVSVYVSIYNIGI